MNGFKKKFQKSKLKIDMQKKCMEIQLINLQKKEMDP